MLQVYWPSLLCCPHSQKKLFLVAPKYCSFSSTDEQKWSRSRVGDVSHTWILQPWTWIWGKAFWGSYRLSGIRKLDYAFRLNRTWQVKYNRRLTVYRKQSSDYRHTDWQKVQYLVVVKRSYTLVRGNDDGFCTGYRWDGYVTDYMCVEARLLGFFFP